MALGAMLLAEKCSGDEFTSEDEIVAEASAQTIAFMLTRCPGFARVGPYNVKKLDTLGLCALPASAPSEAPPGLLVHATADEIGQLPQHTNPDGPSEQSLLRNRFSIDLERLVYRTSDRSAINRRMDVGLAEGIPSRSALTSVAHLVQEMSDVLGQLQQQKCAVESRYQSMERRIQELRQDLQVATSLNRDLRLTTEGQKVALYLADLELRDRIVREETALRVNEGDQTDALVRRFLTEAQSRMHARRRYEGTRSIFSRDAREMAVSRSPSSSQLHPHRPKSGR